MNLLQDDIGIIKNNTETVVGARKEVCIEVHTKKTEYMP
jgi:hypothetical protein